MARAIRPALTAEFRRVVLYARSELDGLAPSEQSVTGHLEDFEALKRACQGIDVVIHLGGKADESDFSEILDSNIRGTYNVFEAARSAGVRRVVYASSHHVTGFHDVDTKVDADSEVRPDTFYAVSKVFGEALGRLYHDKWGLEVVCLRIGVCREEPENTDQLRTWLSIPDSIRLVRAAAVNELTNGYVTTYGVSKNAERFWDASNAAQIGFEAADSADEFRSRFPADRPFSTRWQGGAFTAGDYRGGIW